jgi:hypothetical protein
LTNPLEHVFIAIELARLGVKLTSLAPRFIGRFEKGVRSRLCVQRCLILSPGDPGSCRRTRMDIQFFKDRLQVSLHCIGRDDQFFGNFLVG